jgi:hypothetical protein
MLIGYGHDHNRSSHHTVLALDHVVREALRLLIAEEDRVVLLRRPLGSGQQRIRVHRRIHAERSCHNLLTSTKADAPTIRPRASSGRDTPPPAALVGVQLFGGFGMSGTDSNAGGPAYLPLHMLAKTVIERF